MPQRTAVFRPLLGLAVFATITAVGCKKDVKELVPDGRPALPPPVSALQFGMTADEARQALPALPAGGVALELESYGEVKIRHRYGDEDALESVTLELRKGTDAMAIAEAAWGTGEPYEHGDAGSQWLNAEAGVRASVEQGGRSISFDAFASYDAIFGGEGPLFPFESELPILGATREALGNAYRLQDVGGIARLRLPSVRCGHPGTDVEITFADGKAHHFDVVIMNLRCDPPVEEITSVLKAKFGQDPKPYGRGGDLLLFSEDPRMVALKPDGDTWRIGVAPKPAAAPDPAPAQ